MSYRIKEIFYSLQGEGARSGRPAIFCRFSGCNLWSGKENDREKSHCRFCDTDFSGTDGTGGGVFESQDELTATLAALWPAGSGGKPYLIFTGGEPALQLDEKLVQACRLAGFETAVETNGTLGLPEGLDWICVSPKPGAKIKLRSGDELKLLYPIGLDPSDFQDLEFDHFFLQPVDDGELDRNRSAALEYCLSHPQWRLSLQLHKILQIT